MLERLRFPVGGPDLDRYLVTQQAVEDYCNELVDGGGRQLYLDKSGSVSAMVEVEDDYDYDVKMLGSFPAPQAGVL